MKNKIIKNLIENLTKNRKFFCSCIIFVVFILFLVVGRREAPQYGSVIEIQLKKTPPVLSKPETQTNKTIEQKSKTTDGVETEPVFVENKTEIKIEKTIAVKIVKNKDHKVKKGETLYSISKKHYGTSQKWRLIAQANRKVLRNYHIVKTGQLLNIPPCDSKLKELEIYKNQTVLNKGTNRYYKVKKGDTLSKISAKVYNSPHAWKRLLKLNAKQIRNVKVLKVGTMISY